MSLRIFDVPFEFLTGSRLINKSYEIYIVAPELWHRAVFFSYRKNAVFTLRYVTLLQSIGRQLQDCVALLHEPYLNSDELSQTFTPYLCKANVNVIILSFTNLRNDLSSRIPHQTLLSIFIAIRATCSAQLISLYFIAVPLIWYKSKFWSSRFVIFSVRPVLYSVQFFLPFFPLSLSELWKNAQCEALI